MRPVAHTRPAASAPGVRRAHPVLVSLAIAALACVVYANALHNPFVYDDHDTVTANPSIVELSNVRFLLVYSPFRPVVNISYGVDRFLWGTEPLGFHVTNVALHATAAVLLYLLILRLMADAGSGRGREMAAFAGASFFALHPLQTEAVGYISGRSELMCAVWFLAAMLAARRAIVSGSRLWTAAAVVFGIGAVASKEVGVVLPLVILAYDWLLRPGDEAARRRRLWMIFVPALLLVAALGLLRLFALGVPPRGAGLDAPFLTLLTQSIVIWRYAGLLLWPAGQSIMHSVHRATSAADLPGLTALAALVGVGAMAFRVRRSYPLVALGALWFLAVLIPSSTVFALRESMAEHRAYLASAGVFLVTAQLMGQWVERRPVSRGVLPSAYAITLFCVFSILYTLTLMRNQVWASPVSIWTEATLHAEGMWEPHYALADSLRESGDCPRAVPEYRRVVDLHPSHRDAHTNLGICLARTGQPAEAERSFRRALEIDPSFARGYTNLGALALTQGNAELATTFYREALLRDPRNILARMQLASLFEHTFQDYNAAAQMCGEARLLAPSTPGVVDCMERNQRLAAARNAGR